MTFIPPTEFAEDSAHTSGDKGVESLLVQKATPADLASEGDYAPAQMSAGRVWTSSKVDNAAGASAVNIQDGGNSITVDNGGTFAVQATLAAETTKVIGTVNQGTSPWVVSGTVTANPAADVAPATQNITVVDSVSTTTSGANNQSLVTGTPTAGSAASFTLSNIETIRVEVTGTWTGTLTAETSIDGGTTWTPQGIHQGAYTAASFTAGFIGGANVAGATNFRIRGTATITGTAVVKVVESINTQSVYIANAAPSGTVISALNSSSATLTSGSVFTGTGEDVTNFSEMRVSVFSNVASASDGISLQQSTDNTNWDITDVYTIPAATGKTFVVPRQARYFRIVYTNGGTNQASFRLQTILNRTATAPSSNRASDAYSNETDLVQNQVFPMGYNGTTWDRLRTVGTGVLSTSAVLTAGSAVIGHVISDTGSTTAVTQATASNLNATVVGTGTLAVQNTQQGTASQNVAQLAGTTTDTNSGVKSAGTLRVVLATDQPQLTNKLLVTPDSVALPANQSVNISQINGVTTLMGNGVTGTGSQRVTIASDNTAFAVNATLTAETTKVIGTTRTLGNAGAIIDGVNTAATAPANGVMQLGIYNSTEPSPTTGQSVGVQLDSKGRTRTVVMDAAGNTRGQNVNANSAAMIAIDQTTVGTTNAVTTIPVTSGGLTVYHLASAATTNLQVPKASAGQLYGYMVSNTSAAYSYLCFHNSATTPTAGASIFFKIGIPAGGAANVNFDNGIAFSSGIAISTVTGAADNNTTAVALNDLIINLFYK